MLNNTKMKILAFGLAVALTACGGAEERKAKYMEKGKEYFAEKNFEKAKIEFKNVMQIDPKFAEAFYFMGQAEEQNRDLQKAAGSYNQAIQLDPGHNNAKAKLARIFSMVGTDEYVGKAKDLLKEVFASEPEHLEATLVDAMLDSKDANKDQAIAKLKKIIEKDALFTEAYTVLAVIYAFKDQDDEAISLLKSGIEKNNTNVMLRATLAQLLSKGGRDLVGAEEQAKKITELEPDNFDYRVALATFYSAINQQDKAEAVLRQAIKDQDDDAKRYLVLVEFLARTKNAKAAESELMEAIKKQPKLHDLQFALVDFYQKLKVIDKAIAALTAISEKQDIESAGLKAKTRLADIYLLRGEMKQSQKLIEIVLGQEPNNAGALLVKGKQAFMMQDDQTAINALRAVLKDDSKNSEAALLLAQAHERNNEFDLAKETLVHTLEADPLNPRSHINLSNYLASKNELDKAEQTLDRALTYFKVDYDLLQAKLKLAALRHDDKAVMSLLDVLKQNYPNKEDVYMMRGQFFAAKKQYPQALEEFELALQGSVTHLNPLEAIVKTHIIMGQEQKAIEKLHARLAANADDVLASTFLGQIYAARNDKIKALEYFDNAMKQGSWDSPYISASIVHLSNKDIKSALSVLEKGAAKVANPASIQMQMASIYEGQKDFDKAITMYEKIVNVNSSNQMAANNLASLLLDHRSDVQSAKRALELTNGFDKTKHPAAMDTLGWALFKNNDVAKAISILEEVTRMEPDVGVFQYHLGMAYHQAGDKVNAKRYLSMAVASKQNYPGKGKAKETLGKL